MELKTPNIPFKLCKNLYEHSSDQIKLRLAIKDDKVISGLIDLW